jgi:hypothetical protein
MLCPDLHGLRVYLHRAPVDMRKQRNGLAALVRVSTLALFDGRRIKHFEGPSGSRSRTL